MRVQTACCAAVVNELPGWTDGLIGRRDRDEASRASLEPVNPQRPQEQVESSVP